VTQDDGLARDDAAADAADGRAADGTTPDATASDDTAAEHEGRKHKKHKKGSVLREVALIVVVALVVSALVRAFLFQAFYIPSGSMENTLAVNDRVIVNKIGTDLGSVKRGDVVVFRDPGGWLADTEAVRQGNALQRGLHRALEVVGLAPSPADQDVIKRVIGVGGDRVQCCGDDGKVTVNGVPLDEPYVYPGANPSDIDFDVTVPEGRLFVMGDHRNDSNDSRVQGRGDAPDKGTIPLDLVVGRAVLVVWPLDHWGTLDAPDTFKNPALDQD
jgi:signal peptidase I